MSTKLQNISLGKHGLKKIFLSCSLIFCSLTNPKNEETVYYYTV
jgi:hypothetical protein